MAVADEKQRTFEGKVSRVQVTAPLPILENGLVLADTPGFNAVQLEGRQGTHQQALEDYLRTRTSQVFWVVRATFGVDRAEKGFFERFLGEVCDDIIVTGSESLDDGQRLRWRRRVAAHLRGHTPRFHFVSGLHGAEAMLIGDPFVTPKPREARHIVDPEPAYFIIHLYCWAVRGSIRRNQQDV